LSRYRRAPGRDVPDGYCFGPLSQSGPREEGADFGCRGALRGRGAGELPPAARRRREEGGFSSVDRVQRRDGSVVWRVLGRKRDAEAYDAELVRRKRTGELAALDVGKQSLSELGEESWPLSTP